MVNYKKALFDAKDNCTREKEMKRIQEVINNYEGIYPPDNFPCPICLEDAPLWAHPDAAHPLVCCGQYIHLGCMQDAVDHGHFICPLCNGKIPLSDEEMVRHEAIAAERGFPWANLNQAIDMYDRDIRRQEQRSRITHIANDDTRPYPPAMVKLGKIYEQEGDFGNAMKQYTRAAERGSGVGHQNLANIFLNGHVDEPSPNQALVHLTLAYVKMRLYDKGLITAMGCYYDSPSLGNNSILSIMYLIEASEGGFEAANLPLAKTIVSVAQRRYGNDMFRPGMSSIPKAFFYASKTMTNEATHFISEWSFRGRSRCSYCDKSSLPDKNFCRCSRCKAAWYCGRECQTEAWKNGHREECFVMDT